MFDFDSKSKFVSYEIVHETTYSYEHKKRSSVMTVCMQPKATSWQFLDHYQLATTPESAIDIDVDPFGNTRHFFDIHRPHNKLTVTSNARVRSQFNEEVEVTDQDDWNALAKTSYSVRFLGFSATHRLDSYQERPRPLD